MAGTHAYGDAGMRDHESLVHFKNGQLNALGGAGPDCTERTNLRKYGTGDFSPTAKVCVGDSRVASTSSEQSMSMEMDGGVGASGGSSY
jgi:hypothetical protein